MEETQGREAGLDDVPPGDDAAMDDETLGDVSLDDEAAAPAEVDSLSAELDALLAGGSDAAPAPPPDDPPPAAPEPAPAPPAAPEDPPPPPASPPACDAADVWTETGRAAWVAFGVAGVYVSKGGGAKGHLASALQPFARRLEVRDVRVRLTASEPFRRGSEPPDVDDSHPLTGWSSEPLEAPALDEGPRGAALRCGFAVPARCVGDGRGDRLLRLSVVAKVLGDDLGASSEPRVLGVATFSLRSLVEAEGPVARPLAPGAGAEAVAFPLAGGDDGARRACRAVGDAAADALLQPFAFFPRRFAGAPPIVGAEGAAEPSGVHAVVADALQPVADGMLEAAAAWMREAERARGDQALFKDDEDARRRGARRVRVQILGARGLRRAPRSPPAAAPAGLTAEAAKAKLGAAASSFWGLAKRLKEGDAPRLGMDDGGDAAPPNPLVRCRLRADARGSDAPLPLGRTNTEYATESPSFGTNARAKSACAHAKPSTAFEAAAPRCRLAEDAGAPLGVAPALEFYARRDECGSGRAVLEFEALDERYGVARGVDALPLGTCDVAIPAASSAPPPPAWVPLGAGGELFLAVHASSLDAEDDEGRADAAFADAERSGGPAPAALRGWLGAAGVACDALDGGPVASRDPDWLEAHATSLARDGARLARFASEARDGARAARRAFKSSMRKGDVDVAALPTNLHCYVFQRSSGAAKELWTCATSGAPTAAATLGAARGGLRRLERELGRSPRGRALEARAAACAVRKALCVAHALCVAGAAVRAKIAALAFEGDAAAALETWRAHGVPVVFLALVSATGAELAMLEDAASAAAALEGVRVQFGAAAAYDAAARVLTLDVPAGDVDALGLGGARLDLRPFLFSQGLDAKQSLANSRNAVQESLTRLGRAVAPPADDAFEETDDAAAAPDAREIQNALNVAARDGLAAYAAAALEPRAAAKALKYLSKAVDKETASLDSKTFEKHWLVLVEAERAARALRGALCVFCKSGKDRTGMAVTLAAAMFVGEAATAPDDDEALMLDRANALREHGVRVRICEKNTGRKKYAFNVIQREFLPYPYRPPTATIEDLLSSTIHRDTS